jgi:hypothetical protein
LFSGITDNIIGLNLQHVESDSLGQRSALASNDDIAFLDLEAGRAVAWDIFMSFLETLIFLHVVEVVSTDNNCVGHLGGNNHTPESKNNLTILPLMETLPVKGHFLSM